MQKYLKLKKLQREITKKISRLELSILCTVCLFMWVYIPTRYHPNALNSFGVIEHTVNLVLVRTVFAVYELIKIIFLRNGTVRTNKMKF